MTKDFYQILGVSKSSSEDEIKQAYKKLAKKYHPDLNKEADAEKKFKDINEAYQVLSDPNKKQSYDQYGNSDFSEGFSGGHGQDSPFDFFSNFFTQQGNDGFYNQGERQNKQKTLQYSALISFLESIKGCEYTFTYKTNSLCADCKGTKAHDGDKKNISTCSMCNGSGVETVRVKTPFGIMNSQQQCSRCGGAGQKISKLCKPCKAKGYIEKDTKTTIKIPAGIQHGEILSFQDTSYKKQKIYIEVMVKHSGIFERKRNDIYTKVVINPLIAIFGGTVDAPTPDGVKKIKIPEGTQFGEFLKLKGLGVSGANKYSVGDLFIKVEFAPLKLSPTEMKVLQSINIADPKEGKKWIEQAEKEIKGQ